MPNYTFEMFNYDISMRLSRLKQYYSLVSLCQPTVSFQITKESLFSDNILLELNALYKNICVKEQEFAELLKFEQSHNSFNSATDAEQENDNIQLLYRYNNERDSNRVSPQLNQAVSNLYHLISSIYSIASEIYIHDDNDEIAWITIDLITHGLENSLQKLSDNIEKLPVAVRSSNFSLGRYLEKLEENYEYEYDHFYWISSYFRRHFFRNPERIKDIKFIMNLSKHYATTEDIRCAIMYVEVKKILDKEESRSKNTSILKKVLDAGLERTVELNINNNKIRTLSLFFKKYEKSEHPPNENIPEKLQDYINQHRLSPKLKTY